MPTREQTIADAIELFENAEYPAGLTVTTAWMGIYQALLWFEPVNWVGFSYLPHIIDADKLRPASPTKQRGWTSPNAWQRRAQAVASYLAKEFGCSLEDLPLKTDLLMNHDSYRGMQRQNTLGIAFAGIIKHVLERYGSSSISYESEVEAGTIFPGITIPGRSGTPRIDVLGRLGDLPRAVISTKWSVRHDRLNDITNEGPAYKAAYTRIYRRPRHDKLSYFVVTDEYDPARLNKMLDDPSVDNVVHVHKAAVVRVCELDGRLDGLVDLADFVQSTSSWWAFQR